MKQFDGFLAICQKLLHFCQLLNLNTWVFKNIQKKHKAQKFMYFVVVKIAGDLHKWKSIQMIPSHHTISLKNSYVPSDGWVLPQILCFLPCHKRTNKQQLCWQMLLANLGERSKRGLSKALSTFHQSEGKFTNTGSALQHKNIYSPV